MQVAEFGTRGPVKWEGVSEQQSWHACRPRKVEASKREDSLLTIPLILRHLRRLIPHKRLRCLVDGHTCQSESNSVSKRDKPDGDIANVCTYLSPLPSSRSDSRCHLAPPHQSVDNERRQDEYRQRCYQINVPITPTCLKFHSISISNPLHSPLPSLSTSHSSLFKVFSSPIQSLISVPLPTNAFRVYLSICDCE